MRLVKNSVQWFVVNPIKKLFGRRKEREDDNAKKKYFRDVGLLIVLCMSLYTYCNLKFNSVYYAQHIPHKEGTEPDIIMLMENNDWIYTPEIDGISYDDDGSYAITREKGTKTSILRFFR